MKKTVLYIFCVVALILSAGCKDNPQEIAEKQLAAAVSQVITPHKVDNTTTLTSISLQNRVLTSKIEIPAERLAKIKSDSLTSMQIERLTSNFTSRKVRELALKADVTFRYVYINGSDSLVLVITPADMMK